MVDISGDYIYPVRCYNYTLIEPIRSRGPVLMQNQQRPCPAILAVFLTLCPFIAHAFDGPLQVRNQFPLLYFLNPPYLESAAVRDRATVALTYSSVYITEENPPWTVNVDMELAELMVRFSKSLNARTEVGLDIPFYRSTKGFLDRPLGSFHDALHTGDYGRDERPDNEFLYELLYQGMPVIKPVSGQSGIGDVRLTIKRVVSDGSPLVSLMANVEIPTGDAKTGFGNGSVDAAFAVLVDLDLGKRYRGYGNAGVVLPGDLKGYQTIPMRAYAYAGFGVEAAWWDHFSVIVQTVVAGSPYPGMGIRKVDWPGVLLTFGGRYSFGSSRLEFSLTEDPDTAGAPDFMANVTYTMSF
jgi:hypothetical protein